MDWIFYYSNNVNKYRVGREREWIKLSWMIYFFKNIVYNNMGWRVIIFMYGYLVFFIRKIYCFYWDFIEECKFLVVNVRMLFCG